MVRKQNGIKAIIQNNVTNGLLTWN